jgi:KH domain
MKLVHFDILHLSMTKYNSSAAEIAMSVVAKIIGKNGHNIQDIVDKSGVVRVKIEGDTEQDDVRQSSPAPATVSSCRVLPLGSLDSFLSHVYV